MEKEKKDLYFTCYDPIMDIYKIEKSCNYSQDYFKNYILHGNIYNKNYMVFNSLDDALKDLKRVSKPIKYINI